ncbi:Ref family protein [Pseudomonas sp. ZM23]|uniref:Ref family recombination enhancement nuclease n=1 Tax=Pseudomonas triclosanedens TaxID=2961893 RepID=A0ABY6ZSE6_9PSED|nr:Ref family recombination enhancement nuclease [Pseudomonas triclosanedens]MCP8465911.1 Ref family protein [Pseudomonas triclosanedens]MCP8472232.1 Ref family protein [Pseudomonas triclosanedens]MCP8477210.1 Ref family protein [Pseudomonas triclosanedens]WAI47452.1 Ref family recombination enhancement nuclease [Pseudomonas triclosanedens]
MKGRNPTAEQKRWHDLLSRVVGCIACREGHGSFNDHCSIHHVDGRTKPHAHWYVLPLCAGHHQDGTGPQGFPGIAVHPFKARFEERYGAQSGLLSRCAQIIAEQGYDIPVGFLSWLDGSEVMA